MLAQQRQPRVAHTRIVAIITDALCQAASKSMPLIKSPQRQQAGITGDLTARKISSNGSMSVEGKQQLWYTRCHLWVLRKRVLGSLKPSVHQSFRAPFLFPPAKS
jgi:hypothetical protein